MMKKTKVAFFSDVLIRDYDGCNRTLFQIIDRTNKDKIDFKFFSSVIPKKFPYKKFKIPSITFPFNKSYRMSIPHILAKNIERELDTYKPDVIHITTPSPLGFFALKYANKKGIAVTTIYHTHFVSYVDYYLKNFNMVTHMAKKQFIRWTQDFYNKCNRVFVPTKDMKKDLLELNVKNKPMRIWPRGIDKNIFHPLKKNLPYIQSITKNKNPNILFASRLVWEKNLETLIQIYNELESQKIRCNFLIAGDGIALPALKQKMPNAVFLGKLTHQELSSVYASSEVFVFPSISETFGNVVIEAMASGCACVIANGGGSRTFVDHGSNGFLCSPNDAKEYVNHIKNIISDEELFEKIRSNSIQYAAAFDWDNLILNLEDEWSNFKVEIEVVYAA